MTTLAAEKQLAMLEDFRGARREQRRLSAALAIFLQLSSFEPETAAPILEYLTFRKRSAVEELIRLGSIAGIRAFAARAWIEEKYLPGFRTLASDLGQLEIWAFLYRFRPGQPVPDELQTPAAGRSPDAAQTADTAQSRTALSEQAFRQLFRRLTRRLPGFGPVLETLALIADHTAELSSDGFAIYYDPDAFLASYLEDSDRMVRHLMHLLLHNIYFHPLLAAGHDERLWSLACDIFAENLLDHWEENAFARNGAEARGILLHERRLDTDLRSAEAIYRALCGTGSGTAAGAASETAALTEAQLRELERRFRADAHDAWAHCRTIDLNRSKDPVGRSGHGGEHGIGRGPEDLERLKKANDFAEKWGKLRTETAQSSGASGGQRGSQAGSRIEEVPLIRKHKTSYRDFLYDFMVCREEIELDLDSFDYLPYWYSREHYEDIVLLEPLEYREMYKLDEMVIAIDTSGSCRGEIVKAFLEETWNILTEKGNFFRNMNVHIIQCDSMIQDHAVIRSREEFEAYMEHPKVQGFGGTDFRPVFDLVDELIRRGELKNLKGLLYFTDGDGIYPTEPPQYETAFIFLNERTERQSPPVWALRLNLGLSIDEPEEDF